MVTIASEVDAGVMNLENHSVASQAPRPNRVSDPSSWSGPSSTAVCLDNHGVVAVHYIITFPQCRLSTPVFTLPLEI
jgi:hypothetical protein